MLSRMARQTQVVLISDLSGEHIPHGRGTTLTFTINGITYELDATDAEAAQFDDDLRKYTSAARRTGGRRDTRGRNSTTDPEQLAAIRQWARANGHTVSDRGRIPNDVQTAYKAAH